MHDVSLSGRTILFVSHNMAAIRKLCSRSLLLANGQIAVCGSTADVIAHYVESGAPIAASREWPSGCCNAGIDEFKFLSARVGREEPALHASVPWSDPVLIRIEYELCERLPFCRIGFVLTSADGTHLFDSYDCDDATVEHLHQPGRYSTRCEIPGKLLKPGKYFVTLNAGIPGVKNLAHVQHALMFRVTDSGTLQSNSNAQRLGILLPQFRWTTLRSAAHEALA